jgi:hypothetical protein
MRCFTTGRIAFEHLIAAAFVEHILAVPPEYSLP